MDGCKSIDDECDNADDHSLTHSLLVDGVVWYGMVAVTLLLSFFSLKENQSCAIGGKQILLGSSQTKLCKLNERERDVT